MRLAAALVLLAACAEPADDGGALVCSRELTTRFWGWYTDPRDVLIVMDRSPSMADDWDPITLRCELPCPPA